MIPEQILSQLDATPVQAGKPMVITDADEVLFAFMAGLESYLSGEGLSFDFSSFAITGNVKDQDGQPLDRDAVRSHLGVFFERHTEELDPVDQAADALARLSEFLASERTAAECFPALFKRTIGEGEYGLALGESYAHLNHLLLTGRATRQRRDDGAWLWNAK